MFIENHRKNRKEGKANPKIVGRIKICLGMIHLILSMFKLIFILLSSYYCESYKINEKLKLMPKCFFFFSKKYIVD